MDDVSRITVLDIILFILYNSIGVSLYILLYHRLNRSLLRVKLCNRDTIRHVFEVTLSITLYIISYYTDIYSEASYTKTMLYSLLRSIINGALLCNNMVIILSVINYICKLITGRRLIYYIISRVVSVILMKGDIRTLDSLFAITSILSSVDERKSRRHSNDVFSLTKEIVNFTREGVKVLDDDRISASVSKALNHRRETPITNTLVDTKPPTNYNPDDEIMSILKDI